MGKSSYLTTLAATAIVAANYLINPGSAYSQTTKPDSAQTTQQTRRDLIYSSNPCLSATGEGVLLKRECHPLPLAPNSRTDIGQMFELFSVSGKLDYTAVSGNDGIKMAVSYLKGEKQTLLNRASVSHLEKELLRLTPDNDPASVAWLNEAVSDGVVDAKDSLFSGNNLKLEEGLYAIVARSSNESIPILVKVSYDASEVRREQEARNATAKADSIAKLRVQYQSVRDSLATLNRARRDRELFVKDSLDMAAYVEQQKGSGLKTRFGLEAGYGTNKEGIAGAFVEVPLTSAISVEGFGDYFVLAGNADSSIKADTTARERQLIGPGTYKDRVDKEITTSEHKSKADFGLGLLLGAGDLRFNVRGGVNLYSMEEETDGESTISFERNGVPLGQPETITNSKGKSKGNSVRASFSAGALYDVNRRFSVGASYDRFGKKNGGRINLRLRF